MAMTGERFSAGFATLLAGMLIAGVARADRISHPTAVFAGLDKITGRIIRFDVAIDETVQFGSLQITPRVCYTRPQTEEPQTDGFVQVDEVASDNKTKQIFSGWMFAASPGLNAVEHPVYDVWLTDCKGEGKLIASAPESQETDAQAGQGTPAAQAVRDTARGHGLPVPPPAPAAAPKGFSGPPVEVGLAPGARPAPEPRPEPRRQPTRQYYPTTSQPDIYKPDPGNY